MSSIVDLLKKECVGIFAHVKKEGGGALTFGVDELDSSRLRYLCLPYTQNYSGMKLLFLPKPFAVRASTSNIFFQREESEELFVFHYALDKKRLIQNVHELYKNDLFFWNQEKSLPPEQRMQKEPVLPQQYLDWFLARYEDASCMYANVLKETIFFGRKENMQVMMDHLKAAPNNLFDVLKEITGINPHSVQQIRNLDVYDFVKKPNYVQCDFKQA